MLSRTLELANQLPCLDQALEETSPSTLIITTIALTLMLQKGHSMYQQWDSKRIKDNLFANAIHLLGKTPYLGNKIQHYIDSAVAETLASFKKTVDSEREDWDPIDSLPSEPLAIDIIKKRFNHLGEDADKFSGKISGTIYTEYSAPLLALLQEVWSKTALTNPLHANWPLINLMKAEVISWCQNLLNGQSGAHGIITHGGTTSIIEACFAYVTYARKQKGITQPEILVPETVHVAFDKAAELLNVKLVKVAIDPNTGKVNVAAMARAITKRTCLLVGSAPSFPFGIIDPITELGILAQKHHLPLHVDACLGGFVTVFAKKDLHLPPCDFSVPGVTSISMDTHKYGQTPKGTSVLLFSPSCRATPTQTYLDWVGGMYVTESMDGSRSGADIALAWTVMAYKGKRYYMNVTAKILTLKNELVKALQKIEGIEIGYDPQLSVVGIRVKPPLNPLLVAEEFEKYGWSINILQTSQHKPDGFHFCLTEAHTHIRSFIKNFITDLSSAMDYVAHHPQAKPKGMAKAYGMVGQIPAFLQKRIGEGYIKIQNTLPNKLIPGIWYPPVEQNESQNRQRAPKPKIVPH